MMVSPGFTRAPSGAAIANSKSESTWPWSGRSPG
jgi:hypothetical protein